MNWSRIWYWLFPDWGACCAHCGKRCCNSVVNSLGTRYHALRRDCIRANIAELKAAGEWEGD